MPSTVTGLTQYFIAGAAEAFAYRIAPLNAFTKAVIMEGARQNDIVRVPFVTGSITSTSDFTHANGYGAPDSYTAGVAVTLSNWKYRQWNGTDSDLAHLTPESVRGLGHKVGNDLGHSVVANILQTTSSFTNKNQASGSSWASTTGILDLSLAASNNKWNSADKTLLASPALYWKAAGNTTTLIANALGNSDVIQKGVLANYYGWKVIETDSVPSTVQGLAVTPQALAVAIAVPTPQPGHDLLEVTRLQAPDGTDLPIQYVRYYDTAKRTMVNVFECIYGATVLDTSAAFNVTVTNMDK